MTTCLRGSVSLAALMVAALMLAGCNKHSETVGSEQPESSALAAKSAPQPSAPAVAESAPTAPNAPNAPDAPDAPNTPAGADAWMTDFDAAKAVAAKNGKDLLVDFSGSDWCGWCIKLDKEVFGEDEFIKAASKDFVLVNLDFPKRPENKAKIPKALRERNAALRDEMGIRGYPTVLLMDSNAVVYAQTGYQRGGTTNYLEHLRQLREDKAKKDALVRKLSDTSIKGLDRARLLNEIIEATPDELALKYHADDMKKIIELDADNAAGLKSVYQLKLARGEARAAMTAGDFKKAAQAYDDLIAELKPTGQDLQDLWVEAGEPYFYQKDMEGVRKCLDNALKAAPEGKQVQRIKAMLKQFFPDTQEAKKPETPKAAPEPAVQPQEQAGAK